MKRFFKEHRIFTILMAVLLVCIVVIGTVLIQCFYVGNGTDKYGNRLEGIEEHEINESRIQDYESSLLQDTKITSASLKITGKILYIDISFDTSVKLADAKTIASKSLEKFSEDELKFYDVNITLRQASTANSDGFLIEGARNKSGHGLKWNNNRQVTATES